MRLYRRVKQSEFLTNTATLVSGTVLAQLVPLLAAPLISRLFTSEDFSVYGVFAALYAIIGSSVTLKYEQAVMLPKSNERSKHLVALCFINSVVWTLLVFLIFFLFNNKISSLFNVDSSGNWLLLVPLAALFFAINTILITWYNRNKKYKVIATNKILRNGILSGGNIGFGLLKSGHIGLIFSQIISDGIAAAYYLRTFYVKALHKSINFKISEIISVAKEYNKFPKFTLPASFLDAFSKQLPILLIAALYSQSLSGSYFFAYKILAIPIAFIGAAYAQTFYQKFVSYLNLENYSGALKFLYSSWGLLFMIIVVPAFVVAFWGEPLFIFIFGSEWAESGKIASILIFYILFAFISSPTSNTFAALGLQKYTLFFSISVLTYRFGTLYAGYLMDRFYLGLILLVCFEIVEVIVYNTVAYKKLKSLIK